ncbi:uncharacterized protein LOC105202489 [Solenopsis invicta]|uniref:uncharacterized protein LOC105202489 n=1 Tax=Solenopsis invicta TaxID=13686 RepID=UPI000595A8ED|nr:uncharacterized protein LOC105202489 [Solenopsis invicta]
MFQCQLTKLNQLTIPRCVKYGGNRQDTQIHGFCDASQYAFGACVYFRTDLGDGNHRCELVCSKSRVAPFKAISLPRLKLSAALLLTRLMNKVKMAMDLTNIKVYLWSDSTITLNWIASESRRYSMFVANRIGEIQRLTSDISWRHVPSGQNPADLLSRGLNPHQLIQATTWRNGPNFLQAPEDYWPSVEMSSHEDEHLELRKIHAHVVTMNDNIVKTLLNNHLNLNKACRILAYRLKFLRKKPRATTHFISHEEIKSALHLMCKIVQQTTFPEEYKALEGNQTVSTCSKILSLNPFRDKNGLIRVGGRLKHSPLNQDACHPILLPKNHELTRKIITQTHERNLHSGTQATIASVRQQFWPLSLQLVTRSLILKCIKCFKAKPILSEALMGSLLASCVTISRSFSHYAGPLILREGKRRNARNHKAYVAIFVCFATKAVHVELVSDLISDAFLATLKRFISRRGKPAQMNSDNGTAFVGAHNQLQEFFEFLSKANVQEEVKLFLQEQQIVCNFIPPKCPALRRAVGSCGKVCENPFVSNCREGAFNIRRNANNRDRSDIEFATYISIERGSQ